ncbi:hypothetical protein [Methanoregula sp.]|jgi:prefoldin subunit 5|uniref:hypothetical protein n=1 Tax=Methanoregula sp. TaxID=2052170 RepID=UPI003568379A
MTRILELEDRLDALEKYVKRLDECETKIKTLEGKIAKLEAEIKRLNKKTNPNQINQDLGHQFLLRGGH